MAATVVVALLAGLVAVLIGLQGIRYSGDFHPVAFHAPPAPSLRHGPYASNGKLRAAQKLAAGKIRSPEDAVEDAEGTIYFSDASGWIKQLRRGDVEPRDWVRVGGHPLGLAWRNGGREVVGCEPMQGLFLVDVETRSVWLIANSSNGVPLRFTDNAAVASDGSIYFSDASSRYPLPLFFYDILEQRPYGRLLRVNPDSHRGGARGGSEGGSDGAGGGDAPPPTPAPTPEDDLAAAAAGGTGDGSSAGDGVAAVRSEGTAADGKPLEAETVVGGLYFANGVALSQQEDFVVVAETSRFRLLRYWLKGPKAGSLEVFVDNLPGCPDNVNSNGKGLFWVGLVIARQPAMDLIHRLPLLKALIGRYLPQKFLMLPFLMRTMQHSGAVLAVDEAGQVVKFLDDPTGQHVADLTGAVEVNGGKQILLASLTNDYIGLVDL